MSVINLDRERVARLPSDYRIKSALAAINKFFNMRGQTNEEEAQPQTKR